MDPRRVADFPVCSAFFYLLGWSGDFLSSLHVELETTNHCLLIGEFYLASPSLSACETYFPLYNFYTYVTLTFTFSLNPFDVNSMMSTAVTEYHVFELLFFFYY